MFISNIRQCYNSSPTLSVNRLPPEVLQMVFQHLIPPPSTPSWSSFYKSRNEGDPYEILTGAMLVCRKWHSIAVQTASLWTEIDLAARPSTVSCFLERSRAAPIHLRAAFGELENQLVRSVMQHHGHRITKLDFWVWGVGDAELEAYASLEICMPALRQLKLTFRNWGESPTRAHFASPECVPALRALVLSGSLWVPTGVVPNLTHIRLKYMEGVDVSLLWNLLCNAPMLEVLQLSSVNGLTVTHGPTPASSLTLPRLQDLIITGAYTKAIHYLVSRLELPNVTAVSYEYLFAKPGTLSERLLPSSLTIHTPTRVTLVIGGDYRMFTAGFEGDRSAVTLKYLGLSSERNIPPRDERIQWPFITFPTLLSLANVTEFRFASSMWDADPLRRLGIHFRNVTNLCLMTDSDGDFDAGKVMELGASLAGALLAEDPVIFPKLVSLEIDTIDIPREFIELLIPALAKRDRDGRRLQYLGVHAGALWPEGWRVDVHDDVKATGLFDHVDGGYSKRSDASSRQDQWEDQVRHPPRTPAHGYW